MSEYMKVRGGHPWKFIRCDACNAVASTMVNLVEANKCEGGAAEATAKVVCVEALKNETDLLFESCLKDFTNTCQNITAFLDQEDREVSNSSPQERQALSKRLDAKYICNNVTALCAIKKRSPPPAKKPTEGTSSQEGDL